MKTRILLPITIAVALTGAGFAAHNNLLKAVGLLTISPLIRLYCRTERPVKTPEV